MAESSVRLNGIELVWLNHASFKVKDASGRTVLYTDPFVIEKKPDRAEIALVTHAHYDHCAVQNIVRITDAGSSVVCAGDCAELLRGKVKSKLIAISPGDGIQAGGIAVEAVHAYNLTKPFHPKGRGVGYVFNIGGVKIYHAGDTDFTPEMSQLKGKADVALLPIGGKYTMDAKEAAAAANEIRPKIAVPMHYGFLLPDTAGNPGQFADRVKKGIEVKILTPLVKRD
ncbi:MBL fold metallo-hydrolase [Candidatus Micrarchaeota archaeon]|nr:MBL fold metallo-hydrolase [Candidatus Micrarchaeota archaeon]MBI5177582.1 MBL fold metallo-hydrolase [Candidatus Micrarchaeota archaeon]